MSGSPAHGEEGQVVEVTRLAEVCRHDVERGPHDSVGARIGDSGECVGDRLVTELLSLGILGFHEPAPVRATRQRRVLGPGRNFATR